MRTDAGQRFLGCQEAEARCGREHNGGVASSRMRMAALVPPYYHENAGIQGAIDTARLAGSGLLAAKPTEA